jgi:hypothetical protein
MKNYYYYDPPLVCEGKNVEWPAFVYDYRPGEYLATTEWNQDPRILLNRVRMEDGSSAKQTAAAIISSVEKTTQWTDISGKKARTQFRIVDERALPISSLPGYLLSFETEYYRWPGTCRFSIAFVTDGNRLFYLSYLPRNPVANPEGCAAAKDYEKGLDLFKEAIVHFRIRR